MGTPCDCGLPAARITAITIAILAWPEDQEKDVLAIGKTAVPPARASEVNRVFDHIEHHHDLPADNTVSPAPAP